MRQILIDQQTKEELEHIVATSSSMKDVVRKLGYSTVSGNNFKTVKKRIEKYNIDTSHFTWQEPEVRTIENVFCENSTASQAVLRRWQKKYQFTPYKCSICGMLPEWNGKPLTLILDHINGNNRDDRLENLRWVCPNCNQQLETTGYRGINVKNIKKQYYCVCGAKVSRQGNSCKKCISEKNRKSCRASRDELKILIRDTPFTTIANMYGVSDNAIRKWCKSYNLPYHSREILKISDEDWKLI